MPNETTSSPEIDSETWYRRVREEDGSPKIWRYMSFSQFAFILESKSLYFPSLPELSHEDPWEGRSALQERMEADNSSLESFKDGLKGMVKKPLPETMGELVRRAYEDTRVSCWHMNETESYGMWKAYLKSSEGIAIQTTLDGLRAALRSPGPMRIECVSYVGDNHPRLDLPEFLYKRKEFAYEQEVRAHFLEGNFGGVRCISVALDMLIQTLTVDPWSPPWFHELVSSVMARHDLDYIPIAKSKISQQPKYGAMFGHSG